MIQRCLHKNYWNNNYKSQGVTPETGHENYLLMGIYSGELIGSICINEIKFWFRIN